MEELREAVERFFVSQTEAADTFGISVSSMHRYINRGGVPIPLAILVTLLLKGEISVNDILGHWLPSRKLTGKQRVLR